jgi:hypothetical protein
MSRARGWLRRRGTALLAMFLLAVFVGISLAVPRSDRPDLGPGGTAALQRVLASQGLEVRGADHPETGSTFFLPLDFRGPAQAREVAAWVRNGGRLVIADPASETAAAVGLPPPEGAVGGFSPSRTLATDCATPETRGVSQVTVASVDSLFGLRPAEAVGCIHRGEGAYLVRRRLGEGEVIGLGGLSPLTNLYLSEGDNVVLAWNLLGRAGQTVVIGSPQPPGTAPRGLWSLLPGPARVIVLQLALATLMFALVRGRRLGPPPREDIPSPIPATALVHATGQLYRRARASGHGLTLLQDRFRLRAARRLGVGSDADDDEVASAIEASAGIPAPEVHGVLTPRPEANEAALVAGARDLELLERRMEGGTTWER